MRDARSLDGIWQARLDPDDIGQQEGWARPDAPFDRELPVPLPWQAADPALRRYTGVVWYRRSFEVPPGWRDGTVAVRFGAVDYAARVWINGQEVGGHQGGYTPFELEIGDALRPDGSNTLTLRVEDPADVSELPHGKQGGRWYTPISGPWQTVSLLVRPAERVLGLRCYPDAGRGVVRVDARCLVGDGVRRLELDVLESAGAEPVASGVALVSSEVQTARLELTVPRPRLWEPATPHLYHLRATLWAPDGEVLDRGEERFGLRTVEARGGDLLLNGRPLYMRGALDQAYWPDTLYTVPADEEIEREIMLAKEMGLNLLRKHIKPEDPRYLDAADRLGMLIWAEPANPTAFTPSAKDAVRRDLLEMIARDFNHPSIVVWSLYNEDWGLPALWSDPEKQAWLAELYREVKALDPTRLVCDDSGWAHVVTDVNDYHEYYGVPERIGHLRQRLDFIARDPSDNFAHGHIPVGEPMLVSEFGNWSLPNPRDARERSGTASGAALGQDPPWFAYNQAYAQPQGVEPPSENPLTDLVKTVAGFEDRFQELGLNVAFASTDALVEHLHRRAFRALKGQVEEMRQRPELKGYVYTELTDIEWEANGLLDYWRRPKLFHRDLADINADLALIARPERPNAWAGETMVVQISVANTTAQPVHGMVSWRLAGTDLSGETPASAGAFETTRQPTALRFRAPNGPPRVSRLELELREGPQVLVRTYAELAFAARGSGLVDKLAANGHTLDRTFRQRLEKHGYDVPRGFSAEVGLAIANRLDRQLWDYVQAGGRVLYLAGLSGDGAELAGLRFYGLPLGQSWRMASGAAWARADRLRPAPIQPELGWEVTDVFPHQAVAASALQPGDELLAGWFEGWLANGGSFAFRREVGAGQILVSTFRFDEAYGLDPVATLLLNRLVTILQE